MKNLSALLFGTVAITMLAACNKTDFSSVAAQAPTSLAVPVDPVPVPPPVVVIPPVVTLPVVPPAPTYSSKLTNGLCQSDSSTQVLSCLKCDVPQVVGKPQLGAKAQALHDIMVLACSVSNKSDANNFRPTEAMILNKLNRASEENYPDSKRTANMALTIAGLTNPNDDSLRQKVFGGLWYKPPYSTAFETYFGMTTQEAKSTFCYDGDKMNGVVTGVSGLYSKEFMDCQYTDQWYNCKETPAYIAAYGYRARLEKSLKLGVTNPYSKPVPDPQKVCSWEKFEGDDMTAALKQLKTWVTAGRKVSMNVVNSAGVGSCGLANEAALVTGVTVQMATYVCK
ncbi:MAG: hypothetical protein H7256_12265 [Bdellovibrio sp.]|nr:hypothetical protein [Bdellovibrio sp.]